MSAPPLGDDDHPLLFQLRNIRAALAQCQEESHASSVKFQRRSLDNAQRHERAAHLQRENDLLKAELALLRATPAQSEPSSELKAHIQELTLSLRRLSHKLTLAEEVLLDKTKALLNTQANVAKAQAARDAANGLAAEIRTRSEAERTNMRDLALRVRKQEEELRMSDVVICEYAELVRQLEARSKTGDEANADLIRTKSSTLDSALPHGRFDLQQVIEGFHSQYDETCQELEKTRGELDVARSQLLAKQQAEQAVMEDFALTKAELDQLKINDGTAAKMVARQFSQSSTNTLLASLEAMKTRHTATMSTLSSQNQLLLTRIHSLELQNEHLRSSLDELGGEVLKEKYGRRREIGLRIRMGGREQRIVEGLRRWVRQSEEVVKRLDHQEAGAQGEKEEHQNNALLTLSQDARIFLDSLEHGGADEETAVALSGPRARELMVRGGVDELLEDLRIETERRVTLQISGNDTPMHLVEKEQLKSKSREHSSLGDGKSKDIPVSSLSLDDQIENEKTAVVTPSISDGEDGGAESSLSRVEAVVPPQPIEPSSSSQHAADDTASTPDQISTQDRDDSRHLQVDTALAHHDTDESLIVEPPSHSTANPFSPPPIMNDSFDESLPTSVASLVQDLVADSSAPLSRALSCPASPVNSEMCHDKVLPHPQDTLDMAASNSNSLSPLTSEVSEPTMQHMPDGQEETLPHPLLAELAEVNKRYDVIQREFRDCHLALEGLKASLASLSTSQPGSSSTEVHSFPVEYLRPAVARLDDFTEDVRVELEIKVGDEALLIKGYEALLRVPGALSSYTRTVEIPSSAEGNDPDTPLSTNIERQIKAFVDGTDPPVKRTGEMFKAKLEDVQHDIAVLKMAIHDPDSILSEQLPPASASSSSTSLASVQKVEQGSIHSPRPEVGGGWSSWIRGSSSTSPGFESTPTFGNLMTSPRSRQSSYKPTEEERSRGFGILGSFVGLTGKDTPPSKDPLSVLALRIAMPSLYTDGYGVAGNGLAPPTPMSGSIRTPSYPPGLGVGPPPTPRPRTSSTMYMLGLGAYGSGSRVSRTPSINSNGGMDNGAKLENDTEDAGRMSDHDVE